MRLVWLSVTLRARARQIESLAAGNPWAAYEMDEAIEKAAERIIEYPTLGRPGRVVGTREVLVGKTPYLLVYQIESDEITMIRLLHGSMRWDPE